MCLAKRARPRPAPPSAPNSALPPPCEWRRDSLPAAPTPLTAFAVVKRNPQLGITDPSAKCQQPESSGRARHSPAPATLFNLRPGPGTATETGAARPAPARRPLPGHSRAEGAAQGCFSAPVGQNRAPWQRRHGSSVLRALCSYGRTATCPCPPHGLGAPALGSLRAPHSPQGWA